MRCRCRSLRRLLFFVRIRHRSDSRHWQVQRRRRSARDRVHLVMPGPPKNLVFDLRGCFASRTGARLCALRPRTDRCRFSLTVTACVAPIAVQATPVTHPSDLRRDLLLASGRAVASSRRAWRLNYPRSRPVLRRLRGSGPPVELKDGVDHFHCDRNKTAADLERLGRLDTGLGTCGGAGCGAQRWPRSQVWPRWDKPGVDPPGRSWPGAGGIGRLGGVQSRFLTSSQSHHGLRGRSGFRSGSLLNGPAICLLSLDWR